jgi:hypothetical protein
LSGASFCHSAIAAGVYQTTGKKWGQKDKQAGNNIKESDDDGLQTMRTRMVGAKAKAASSSSAADKRGQ